MGGGIDATRHAAHDGQPRLRQVRGEPCAAAVPYAVGRLVPTTPQHDRLQQLPARARTARSAGRRSPAAGPGRRRRRNRHQRGAGLAASFAAAPRRRRRYIRSRWSAPRCPIAHAIPVRTATREISPRRVESLDQLPGFAGAEAGNQAEGQPVQFVFFGESRGEHDVLSCGAGRARNFSQERKRSGAGG